MCTGVHSSAGGPAISLEIKCGETKKIGKKTRLLSLSLVSSGCSALDSTHTPSSFCWIGDAIYVLL